MFFVCSLIVGFQILEQLKFSAASCGESSILKKNKNIPSMLAYPRQAAGNALAGGFNYEPITWRLRKKPAARRATPEE